MKYGIYKKWDYSLINSFETEEVAKKAVKELAFPEIWDIRFYVRQCSDDAPVGSRDAAVLVEHSVETDVRNEVKLYSDKRGKESHDTSSRLKDLEEKLGNVSNTIKQHDSNTDDLRKEYKGLLEVSSIITRWMKSIEAEVRNKEGTNVIKVLWRYDNRGSYNYLEIPRDYWGGSWSVQDYLCENNIIPIKHKGFQGDKIDYVIIGD